MKNELKYSKILESAGLTREQAESHLRVIEGAVLDNVATKQDIEKLRGEFKFEIAEVRADFNLLRGEFNSLEHRLVNKMGVMITTATGVITAISGGIAALLKFAF